MAQRPSDQHACCERPFHSQREFQRSRSHRKLIVARTEKPVANLVGRCVVLEGFWLRPVDWLRGRIMIAAGCECQSSSVRISMEEQTAARIAMMALSRLRAATSLLRFPFSSRGCFGCPTRSVQMRVLPLTSAGGLLRDSHRSTHLHRQHTPISLFQNADHQLSGKALPSRQISLHFGLDSPQINPQHAS